MNHLWSPWRMNYLNNHSEVDRYCVFCDLIAQVDGIENLIIFRGELVFAILNRFPYTSGHLMVVPYEHQPSFEDLADQTLAEIMRVTTFSMRVIRKLYQPQAFNIGANVGEAAGAGIADHVHMHIVPRWTGDTNFMSTLGQTRVLPEELEETYRRISSKWKELQS
jgi:ATP adenylyltransferase